MISFLFFGQFREKWFCLRRLDMKQKQAVREQEANIAPKLKAAELQTNLNRMAAEQHLEFLRSTQLMEATVQVTFPIFFIARAMHCKASFIHHAMASWIPEHS